MVAAGCAIGGWVLTPKLRAAAVPGFGGPVIADDLEYPLTLLLLTLLGGVVVLRGRPRRYGWVMLAAGVLLSVVELAAVYSVYAWYVVPDAGLPLVRTAMWVQDLWMVILPVRPVVAPGAVSRRTYRGRWRRAVPVVAGGGRVADHRLHADRAAADRPLPGRAVATVQPDWDPAGAGGVVNTAWLLVMVASVVVGVGSLITQVAHRPAPSFASVSSGCSTPSAWSAFSRPWYWSTPSWSRGRGSTLG